MARSILSAGMLASLAAWIAVRRRGFVVGSAPPSFAPMVISRMILVKTLPRLASTMAFLCLILAHLLCPDMIHSSDGLTDLKNFAHRADIMHPEKTGAFQITDGDCRRGSKYT